MISRLLVFFGIVLYSSFVFSQNDAVQSKTFENSMFSFNYTEGWNFMEVPSSINEIDKVIVAINKQEDKIKRAKNTYIISFIVYKREFDYKDLDDFIDELRRSKHIVEGQNINVRSSFTKIDSNHYSSIRKTRDLETNKNVTMLNMDSFVHYRLKDDILFTLDLSFSPELVGNIVNDAVLIFDSFHFKN